MHVLVGSEHRRREGCPGHVSRRDSDRLKPYPDLHVAGREYKAFGYGPLVVAQLYLLKKSIQTIVMEFS
jgi:hypothetical protein